MTVEYEIEPIKGLPGNLPKDEAIVWQGSPDWGSLARSVFHTRLVAIWFGLAAMAAFVAGGTGWTGAAITLLVAVIGLALLVGIALLQATTTVYTLTNKRIVMRFGIALPKCVNLPLGLVESADLKPVGGQHVDIVLKLQGRFPLGWLQMWPHVRPWRVAQPEPMLRAVPESLVPMLTAALAKAGPARVRTPVAAANGADAMPQADTPMDMVA